jgi:hypothetical protein
MEYEITIHSEVNYANIYTCIQIYTQASPVGYYTLPHTTMSILFIVQTRVCPLTYMYLNILSISIGLSEPAMQEITRFLAVTLIFPFNFSDTLWYIIVTLIRSLYSYKTKVLSVLQNRQSNCNPSTCTCTRVTPYKFGKPRRNLSD